MINTLMEGAFALVREDKLDRFKHKAHKQINTKHILGEARNMYLWRYVAGTMINLNKGMSFDEAVKEQLSCLIGLDTSDQNKIKKLSPYLKILTMKYYNKPLFNFIKPEKEFVFRDKIANSFVFLRALNELEPQNKKLNFKDEIYNYALLKSIDIMQNGGKLTVDPTQGDACQEIIYDYFTTTYTNKLIGKKTLDKAINKLLPKYVNEIKKEFSPKLTQEMNQ